MPGRCHSCYLCYFGLQEPLVQTQVLPYLRQLTRSGVDVTLLTFEPDARRRWSDADRETMRQNLAADGISWEFLPYHKRPSLPATVFDVVAGALAVLRVARRHPIDVLHARAHVGAAMGMLVKQRIGAKLLFDVRGLVPDEYVDAGVWPRNGWMYRLAKRAEARLFDGADGFVVLTERIRQLLFPDATDPGTDAHGRPIEVIPCCVDFSRFQQAESLDRDTIRAELGFSGRRVIVYVGALGGWYLTEEIAAFMAAAHRHDPSTFCLILTQSAPEQITGPLAQLGLSPADYLVRRVPAAEIPRYLKAADLALSFIKPCYSKLASSPTKLAEYLASGLPVVGNAGIGDVDALIEDNRVGVILHELNPAAYARALDEIGRLQEDPDLARRCRDCALDNFDLERIGAVRYHRLYRRLLPSLPALADHGGTVVAPENA